jgi:hypothetical protein
VEEFMPHRRKIKKGSFAGHLDELVAVAGIQSDPEPAKAKRKPKRGRDAASVHDRLFERAWSAGERKTSF